MGYVNLSLNSRYSKIQTGTFMKQFILANKYGNESI